MINMTPLIAAHSAISLAHHNAVVSSAIRTSAMRSTRMLNNTSSYKSKQVNNQNKTTKSQNKMGEYIELSEFIAKGQYSDTGFYRKKFFNIYCIDSFWCEDKDWQGNPYKDESKYKYYISFNGSKIQIDKKSYNKLLVNQTVY